jgi:nitroreductase
VKIIEEIVARRSIREYHPLPVEKEKLQRILEAGRLAPTARNQQDWRILIVSDPLLKERLVDEASPHQLFLKQAPIILAACALNPDYVMRCGHAAFLIDLAIVLEHIALQAVREGLGTCWIGSFDEGRAKSVLQVPAPVRIVELMSLGYPAALPDARERKPAQDLFRWERW